jgi:hypothetical protein
MLTKREEFVKAAMNGILAGPMAEATVAVAREQHIHPAEALARMAIAQADAVLKEMEASKS